MKYKRNYKGGNLSGNNLDKLPIQSPTNAKYSSAKYEVINTNELIKNYGSVYKSTGGGVSTNKAYKFVYKFIDNRVLDIYLKYLGITTLTPTTLVPLALIAGQDAFKHFLKEMNRKNQVGGQIPIIDNSLIGPFLKIAGISQLNLSLNTLVPLGLAMAIYKTFVKQNKKKQRGGNAPIHEAFTIGKLPGQSTVPPNAIQGTEIWFTGRPFNSNMGYPLNTSDYLTRNVSYINKELGNHCQGNSCSTQSLPTPPAIQNIKVDVQGIGSQAITSNVLGAKPLPENQGGINSEIGDYAMADGQSKVQLSGVPIGDRIMRNQMAGNLGSESYSEINSVNNESINTELMLNHSKVHNKLYNTNANYYNISTKNY